MHVSMIILHKAFVRCVIYQFLSLYITSFWEALSIYEYSIWVRVRFRGKRLRLEIGSDFLYQI